jgi:hypothetical protein
LKVQNMLVCWRDVAAAWALVLALILAVFGTVDLIPSIDRAEASPVLRSKQVPLKMDHPRHEPFNHGLPAFDNDPTAAQGDD